MLRTERSASEIEKNAKNLGSSNRGDRATRHAWLVLRSCGLGNKKLMFSG